LPPLAEQMAARRIFPSTAPGTGSALNRHPARRLSIASKTSAIRFSAIGREKYVMLSRPSSAAILRQARSCGKPPAAFGRIETILSTDAKAPVAHEASTPGGWIGTDEAGKGDYFGPLVVAAVYVTERSAVRLRQAGVRDSKKLSDKRVGDLAAEIHRLCPLRIVVIGPERYNALYAEMRNLNRLLAWAHARAIEDLLGQIPCDRIISDQFADEHVLRRALKEKGRLVHLEQRHHAEEDVAVAAASIIARAEFVDRLARLSSTAGIDLAKGAGPPVLTAGRQYVAKHGEAALAKVAKLHFRTTEQVLRAAGR
jgi:ribonuclease HIII